MRYFVFMTNGGHTWDDAGDEIDNVQQISDPIEVEDDCGALEAYNKMLADRKWYGAFDTCYSLELKSLETYSFDLINDNEPQAHQSISDINAVLDLIPTDCNETKEIDRERKE